LIRSYYPKNLNIKKFKNKIHNKVLLILKKSLICFGKNNKKAAPTQSKKLCPFRYTEELCPAPYYPRDFVSRVIGGSPSAWETKSLGNPPHRGGDKEGVSFVPFDFFREEDLLLLPANCLPLHFPPFYTPPSLIYQ
jgi:hypothetical protein